MDIDRIFLQALEIKSKSLKDHPGRKAWVSTPTGGSPSSRAMFSSTRNHGTPPALFARRTPHPSS